MIVNYANTSTTLKIKELRVNSFQLTWALAICMVKMNEMMEVNDETEAIINWLNEEFVNIYEG